MSELSNKKHERFAQAMASTNPDPREAYRSAGFIAKNDHTASVCASTLLKRKEVKARIQELTQEARNQLAENIEEVLGDIDDDALTRAGRARDQIRQLRQMDQILAERAEAYADLPGGKTGWVILKGEKMVKKFVPVEPTAECPNPKPKVEFDTIKISAVDTKLWMARINTLTHIARELGQYVEKSDNTLEIRNISDLSDAVLDQIIQAAELEEARAKNSTAKPTTIIDVEAQKVLVSGEEK